MDEPKRVPNLDPTIDYGPQLNLTIWMLVSISAIFLFTRLYLKNCQNRGLWLDDYFLLSSWLCLSAEAGLTSHVIGLGYGRQVIPAENAAKFPLPIKLLSTLLIVANLLGKISFALTLLRIPAFWMRAVLGFVMVSMTGTLSASGLLVWIECFAWGGAPGCVSLDIAVPYNLFACAYSAAIDIGLAFLPWKYIWTLEMSKKEKCGVVVAMSMGVFAGIAAIIKTSSMLQLTKAGDATSSVPLVAWGNAEAAICIMAASIPILRALFRGNIVGPRAPPIGYDTGGSNIMTESRPGTSPIQHQARIFSRQAMSPLPGQRQVNPKAMSLDDTLTSGSPEPSAKSNNNNGVDGDDWSDQDSIELTSYQARAETPIDFTRQGLR